MDTILRLKLWDFENRAGFLKLFTNHPLFKYAIS